MNTDGVDAAYGELLSLAKPGGFAAPPPGDWPAERIVAHVIANTRLFCSTLADLLADDPDVSYDSRSSGRIAYIDAIVHASGGWEHLVAALESTSVELTTLLRLVSEEQASRPFPVRINEDERIMVDDSLPLTAFVGAQTRRHVPSHTEQLRALSS